MIYNFKEDQLKMRCINLTEEIKRGEVLLNYDEITDYYFYLFTHFTYSFS